MNEALMNVVLQQEPLFETINHLMIEEARKTNITSTIDKLRTMNLGELYQYAKNNKKLQSKTQKMTLC